MPNKRKIDPAKTIPQQLTRPVGKVESNYSSLQERQREMQVFFSFLQVDNQNFSPEQAFTSLNHYILTYRRILYSTVSNIVYDITDNDDSGMQGSNPDRFGTLLSNIEKLVEYTDSDANMAAHETAALTQEEKHLGVRYH